MRAAIIIGVLLLTGGVFYTAIQSVETTAPTAQITQLEAEIETTRAALEARATELAKAEAALETQSADLAAQLAASQDQNATLTAEIAAERAKLGTELNEVRQALDVASVELATFKAESPDTAALTDQITALSDGKATLMAENTALTEKATALAQTIASLQTELLTVTEATSAELADTEALSAEITAARAEIETLQQKLLDLEDDREEAYAQIAELEAGTATPDVQVAALQARIDEQAAALAEAQAATVQMANYEAELAELSAAVAERDGKIETLRTIATLQASVSAPTAESPLASCQDRTDAVLAGTAITFEQGLTSITPAAVTLLDALSEIATDCMAQDLVLEIEGHTDNSGGNASNLLLSNGRAQAVYAFLADRAVPADAMRAVGFGATDPIADNTTEAGRAQNARIVFDWEQR